MFLKTTSFLWNRKSSRPRHSPLRFLLIMTLLMIWKDAVTGKTFTDSLSRSTVSLSSRNSYSLYASTSLKPMLCIIFFSFGLVLLDFSNNYRTNKARFTATSTPAWQRKNRYKYTPYYIL